MASAENLNHAKAFLRKAEEYLASAQANLVASAAGGPYEPDPVGIIRIPLHIR